VKAIALHEPLLAPSILAANFAHLADEVAEIADAVTMIHVDVMDGHFLAQSPMSGGVYGLLRGHLVPGAPAARSPGWQLTARAPTAPTPRYCPLR